MDIAKLAWLAGLWDGEGSVGLNRNNTASGHIKPILQMSMTCRETIAVALEALRNIGATATGYSYQERRGNHKDAHYIRVVRLGDVNVVARSLQPFAVTKRRHWEIIREFTEIRIPLRRIMPDGRMARGGIPITPMGIRENELYEELRRLNRRPGPDEEYRGPVIGLSGQVERDRKNPRCTARRVSE